MINCGVRDRKPLYNVGNFRILIVTGVAPNELKLFGKVDITVF